jgi:putative ABC transport system permease protein
MVEKSSPEFNGKLERLRDNLKAKGAILEMAESSSPLTQIWNNNGGFEWQGKDPSLDADFSTIWVTHDYGKTVGWQFTKGRDFSKEYSTDSVSMVINEAAVKFMNLKNPVGTAVKWNDKTFVVIGVIKDMLMESPYDPIRQAFYFMGPNNCSWMHIKLNPAKPVSSSLSQIQAAFKNVIPSAPFDYQFADESFDDKFQSEERVSKLAGFFTILAVLISCLGLFGLASYVAEQRRKEIGIRKIVGASVFGVWKLLSKDFLILVFISSIIAIPVSYYYMHNWLENYNYRVEVGWLVFAVAIGFALLITILTISFQAIKAATANPVKSLRTE